jgi:hypothetical protein
MRRRGRNDARVTPAHDETRDNGANAARNYPAAIFAITAMDGGK